MTSVIHKKWNHEVVYFFIGNFFHFVCQVSILDNYLQMNFMCKVKLCSLVKVFSQLSHLNILWLLEKSFKWSWVKWKFKFLSFVKRCPHSGHWKLCFSSWIDFICCLREPLLFKNLWHFSHWNPLSSSFLIRILFSPSISLPRMFILYVSLTLQIWKLASENFEFEPQLTSGKPYLSNRANHLSNGLRREPPWRFQLMH